MIVLLDNYDSFTYNLFQYLSELGQEVKVLRNNETSIKEIENLSPSHLVISPGPSNPENAGISNDSIQYFSKIIPVLGVCLGHQIIGQVFGSKIIQAKKLMHGKTSVIKSKKIGIFSFCKFFIPSGPYVSKNSKPSFIAPTFPISSLASS